MSRLVSILLIILGSMSGYGGDTAAADFLGDEFAVLWEAPAASYLAEKTGNYTYEAEIVVDGGRELGLVLYGVQSEYFYLIDKIEVYDGEKLIQSGLVEEAVIAEWGEGGSYYAESVREDGGISVADMNFDGAGDICLQGWVANANVPCYYWLWDKETEQFSYAFCLCNAEIDTERRQITSRTRDGANAYITDYYAYGEKGELQKIRYEYEDYHALIKKIYDLTDGEWKLTGEEVLEPMKR